jgi:transcriptional regulator with GAF, ATPase, and Fis domain
MGERWWRDESSNRSGLWTPEELAERARIKDAISRLGTVTKAAEHLGMPRMTLIAKLERFAILRPALLSPAQIEEVRNRFLEALALAEGDEARAAERLHLPVQALIAGMDHLGIPRRPSEP